MHGSAKATGLWVLLIIQGVCTLFFFLDGFADLFGWESGTGFRDSGSLEILVALALLIGLSITGYEIREMLHKQTRMENQLQIASGAFSEMLENYFSEWRLTHSEKDVALFAIKGLSIAKIAQIRDTKEGTIKAQCNAIYRKAGVTGRPQLLSVFIEELMNEKLLGDTPLEKNR